MSEKKAKKRLNHERENSTKSKGSGQGEPQKRIKTEPDLLKATSPIKSTPSFGIKQSSNGSQAEPSPAPDFTGKLKEFKDDKLLVALLSPEEVNNQKKKKFDGKFEELSDQFRQRGITKDMRSCIENFSKEQNNYKRIDLAEKSR